VAAATPDLRGSRGPPALTYSTLFRAQPMGSTSSSLWILCTTPYKVGKIGRMDRSPRRGTHRNCLSGRMAGCRDASNPSYGFPTKRASRRVTRTACNMDRHSARFMRKVDGFSPAFRQASFSSIARQYKE